MRRIVPTLALAAALAAGDVDVQLMGYGHLDPQGRPQAVVVALSRARFDALCALAGSATGDASQVVDLAVGRPAYRLSLRGDIVEGRLELPVMLPGDGWHDLRLPMPGTIGSLHALAIGASGPAPRRVAWDSAGDQLVLHLEGGQRALIVITFSLPGIESIGGRRVRLSVAEGLGGQLQLDAPAPWQANSGSLTMTDGRTDLPSAGGVLEVGWDLPAEAAPSDGRLAVEQRIVLQLAAGHVAWSAEMDLASAGTDLSGIRLVPPSGLVVTDVAGDGLSGWRVRNGEVHVDWTLPSGTHRLRLSGIIPRSGSGGRAAVTVGVPGAAVSRGRIGLIGTAGERFIRPEQPGLSSAQPATGEALAVRWNDVPTDLFIAWDSTSPELTLGRDLALVLGEGRARALAALALGGRGSRDDLRLSLPEPWQVVAVDGDVSWAMLGTGDARSVLLTAQAPWESGSNVVLHLEADRGALGERPVLPSLLPLGSGLAAGRLRLAVADAGATRVRLEAADARPLSPEQLTQELARTGRMALLPGERWRSAIEMTSGSPPSLRLEADVPRASAVLSHYLIMGRESVRWSLHIALTPEQGAISTAVLRLPPAVRLVSVSGLGLGRWLVDDSALHLAWVSPITMPSAIDLELDLPAGVDGRFALAAPLLDGVRCEQQIALVEEDDLGLVRRGPDGLGELLQPMAGLPAGVDRAQVPWLWKATRADWALQLSREPLVTTAGADGLATLVDGSVTATPDGELRGRAIWHVVNRTRQQLPLRLSDGVSLWEARIDGRVVRVRQDDAGLAWLPVPTLRPGQATMRVTLMWSARPGLPLRLDPPILGDLKIIASVWRIAAPDGWMLQRVDGALLEADPADAAADRAQAVIDEIQRLQAVDGLNEAGLKRLEGQLALLDSELKDHLISLGRRAGELRGAASASAAWISKVASTTEAISSNSQRLNDLQQQITENFGNRANRRQKLNLDALNQEWSRRDQRPSPTRAPQGTWDMPQRHLPQQWPWDEALPPAAQSGLGSGQGPPGLSTAAGAVLNGIELIDTAAHPVLVLRGQGGGIDAGLRLQPPRSTKQPWAWLLLAAGLCTIMTWLAIRRRN